MGSSVETWIALLAGAGVVAGLWLLVRGLGSYRSTEVVADVGTSRIESVPAGEVRVSGIVEVAEVALVSPLQGVPCVYYRSTIQEEREAIGEVTEERAIGFRVRDTTGSIRVFPRGARFDVPVRFEGGTDAIGDEPSGLAIRQSGSTARVMTDPLAVPEATTGSLVTEDRSSEWSAMHLMLSGRRRRLYREARLEPGDEVTVVGRALPFSDLSDPTEADLLADPVAADDPEVASDMDAARASGTLAEDAEAAWGNAAIPGFGIGRPVSTPDLDPGAHQLPLAGAAEATRTRRTFDIAPETLVLTGSHDVPLVIAFGTPGAVVARGQRAFLTGLLGAVLAIASAMVFAINLDGWFGR